MLGGSKEDFYRGLAKGVHSLIQERVFEAEPIELLSTRNLKLLELVEDINGNQFVRRSYGRDHITSIEFLSGVSFDETWNRMQDTFTMAGIKIVPSFVIKDKDISITPIAIVSEYLPNPRNVLGSSTKAKQQFAESLGNLLHLSSEFLPQTYDWKNDTFHLREDETGKTEIVLTDVDPYLISRKKLDLDPEWKDYQYGEFIRVVTGLFWTRWCFRGERTEVLQAFLRAVAPVLKLCDGSHTLLQFSDLHAKAQGIGTNPFS